MAGYVVIGVDYYGAKGFKSTASVKVRKLDGSEKIDSAEGNGPVDAVMKAIQRALELHIELLEFDVSAVSSGSEAVGEVIVRIKEGGVEYRGSALGTDIVVASAEAFIDALKKKAFEATVAKHTV